MSETPSFQKHRPNILLLMSDEHRADVAGFAGNTVVRTPNLDRLAENAIQFENAYTPSPICVPGRQCIMAGQLPKTCDCEGWIDLKPGYLTYARHLARYAYKTVCSGKLHHFGVDQMQGWTVRLAPDAEISDAYVPGLLQEEVRKYGSSEPGTGKWSNQKELEKAGAHWGPYQAIDFQVKEATIHYIERYFSDLCYDRPQAHRPLLLKVSLVQPHYPYFTDAEKLSYYLNRVPLYDDPLCGHPVLSKSQQWEPVDASTRDIRKAVAAYYGMVETIDDYYGQILESLEQAGQNLDDWIIIYLSDHGEMLGEHAIWEKTRFYEGSVKVPFFIRWPRHYPRAKGIEENVSLCDLFPTLCDLTGVPIPEGLDGESLVPLMDGSNTSWRDEAVSQMGDDHVMIKQGNLKYQYYGQSIPEVLFDLQEDPREMRNVIEDPAYQEAVARFRDRLQALGHASISGSS